MGTPNNELLAQLRNAISGWTAEVGAAQQGLSQQIDGANAQLSRLLAVLRERQELAASLARATEELEHLKSAMRRDQMPAGAVTHYSIEQATPPDAAARELAVTMDKLNSAVQSWTGQVTRSQGGLLEQFNTANGQLSRLLDILAAPDPAAIEELEQLRHENRVLTSEVHALNIEMETFRHEQETFASANLASETERVLKHRRELDQVKTALAERELELSEARRDAETLRNEVARRQEAEDRLRDELEFQRREALEHGAGLGALTREIEALRHAFLSGQEAGASGESDITVPDGGDGAELALEEAEAQITALRARIAELEAHREQAASGAGIEEEPSSTEALDALAEANARLQSQVNELAQRPQPEDLAALYEEAARLQAQVEELSQRPEAEDLAALRGECERLQSQVDVLSQRPAVEDLTALAEENARLQSQVEDLSQRPQPEELAAAGERALRLEVQLASLQEQAEELSQRPEAGELDALRDQTASLQAALDQSRAEGEAERVSKEEAAREAGLRIEALEEEVRSLEAQLAARDDVRMATMEADRAGLQAALAGMEAELAALKRREEETVATARTLLGELETHRTYEAAQDTALAQARQEVARLQDALAERQQQLSALGTALATAETDRAALSGALEEAASKRAQLDESVSRLEAEKSALEAQAGSQAAALAEALARVEALESAAAAAPGPAELEAYARQAELLESQSRELGEYRDSLQTAEKWIAGLESQLEEATRNHEALKTSHDDLAARYEAFAGELDAVRAQERARQDALDEARAETEAARQAAEDRERALAALEAEQAALLALQDAAPDYGALLEEQRAALDERDALIDALRSDIAGMAARTETLAEEERAARRRTVELSEAVEAMRVTDAEYREELEKKRALVDELRTEYARQQAESASLEARGRELEDLLTIAREREITTLASVGELQGALAELEAKEKAEEIALEETRALAATQQDTLRAWERQVSALETRMADLEKERAQLAGTSQTREAEIREAMAQVNQAIHERDELAEELEAERRRKERINAGAAGAGLTAVETREAKEGRARQQEILLSELTHAGQSRSLGDILVDAGILTREQLTGALREQQKDPTQLLGTILIEREYTTDDAIAQAVACQLEKPVVNPMEVHIQKNALAALNRDICTWHVCIPLRITSDRLVVAMANPLDESAIMKLRDASQREITPVVGTASHIMDAIDNFYGVY